MPDPTPVALEELYDDTHRRLLHSGGDEWTGQPYALLDDSAITLVAGEGDRPNVGIGITGEFGTQITGPMSFSEMPQNISLAGGYWRFNPMALTCIGSSAAMPVPLLAYDKPQILAGAGDRSNCGIGVVAEGLLRGDRPQGVFAELDGFVPEGRVILWGWRTMNSQALSGVGRISVRIHLSCKGRVGTRGSRSSRRTGVPPNLARILGIFYERLGRIQIITQIKGTYLGNDFRGSTRGMRVQTILAPQPGPTVGTDGDKWYGRSTSMATEQDSLSPLSPNSTSREAEQNFFDGIFILPNLLPSLPGRCAPGGSPRGVQRCRAAGQCRMTFS
jgi:hypothetical protein